MYRTVLGDVCHRSILHDNSSGKDFDRMRRICESACTFYESLLEFERDPLPHMSNDGDD